MVPHRHSSGRAGTVGLDPPASKAGLVLNVAHGVNVAASTFVSDPGRLRS